MSEFGSRLGSAGLAAGVVVALLAGSSGVAAASEDLGGCMYYAPGEKGGPTTCRGWIPPKGKDLSTRDFTGADFTGARFVGANLRGTNFSDANLTGVKIKSSDMNAATQLRGAIVDRTTVLHGLVGTQEVSATYEVNDEHYFIVGGVTPGLPGRFRPPAVPQGVSIDECWSNFAVTVPASVNGQHVDVKALRPGDYVLACTFFTAGRPNITSSATFLVKVNGSPRSEEGND